MISITTSDGEEGTSTPIAHAAHQSFTKLHPTLERSEQQMRPRILIGCSGSVASLKLPQLVVALAESYEVLVVCTQNAGFFLQRARSYNPTIWAAFERIGGWNLILQDSDEWDMWNKIGNDVLHIELRRWADVLLIAPASANFLAKASTGCADNLLLSVVRAWDYDKPCIICPAMNTFMWEHPVTAPTVRVLESWGCEILGPVVKMLACKEVGNGAMISVDEIVQYIQNLEIPEHGSPSPHRKIKHRSELIGTKPFPGQFPPLMNAEEMVCDNFTGVLDDGDEKATYQSINIHDLSMDSKSQSGPNITFLVLGVSSLFAIDSIIKMFTKR